ncbi:hypothetical protein PGB90_007395 [Kerria lacca]
MENDIEIDYNNNPEEYNEFMRTIRNIEDLFGLQFFDNKIEIDDEIFEFYKISDPDYEGYDSGNEYDIKNYLIRSQIIYNPGDFVSDPDSEIEPDEEIQEDLDDE